MQKFSWALKQAFSLACCSICHPGPNQIISSPQETTVCCRIRFIHSSALLVRSLEAQLWIYFCYEENDRFHLHACHLAENTSQTGFPCALETESVQAGLGCVFKRPRQHAAASKGWKCLFASAWLPSCWRNHFLCFTGEVAPEGLFSNTFQGISTDVLITDSDLSIGTDQRDSRVLQTKIIRILKHTFKSENAWKKAYPGR